MKKPFGMTADQIGEITFVWDGGTRVLTNADGESATMQSMIEQLNALEGTARVELGALEGVILTANVTDIDGKKQELMFYSYDVDSYLLPVTQTHGMLVPAEDVDKLVRMLKQQA